MVYVAHDPPDGASELRALSDDRVTLFPQNGEGIGGRLTDASARVFTRHAGPLLIVWPDLPAWRPEHASTALEDLDHGCQLVLGPVFDGGFYLVGLARPLGQLFTLPEEAWRRGDAMGAALAAAAETGVELGLLRSERGLQRPPDVRAALADPCLPPELARILR